jgi:eukaryotic-like serine/threonine-protein kinase
MWLQDIHQDLTLMVTHQTRVGLRGVEPGGKQERELGWFGWSGMNDMTPDGKQILFDEEGDGGGPNYTIFLRNTDGSPPVRIGEGVGLGISADGNRVITQPAKGGPLSLVPTGAGEARVLTHDDVNYSDARFLADGKHLLTVGTEAGRGVRDYVIDLADGTAKPVTPEGTAGLQISPDGRSVILRGPDGTAGVRLVEGGDIRPIPGIDSRFYITGWFPDGSSVYVRSSGRQNPAVVFKASVATGKMEPWKTFGTNLPSGTTSVSPPRFSRDGSAYVYTYVQDLAQAYVVRGLR